MYTSKAFDTETAKSLLTKVLCDPLGLKSKDHLREWWQLLKAQLPLWAFQASAFLELHRQVKRETLGTPASRKQLPKMASRWSQVGFVSALDVLPTAYPLQTMVNGILDDDGLKQAYAELLTPLERTIDVRRSLLAGSSTSVSRDWRPDEPVANAVFPNFSARDKAIEAHAAASYDPNDPEPCASVYEEIGQRLVAYVEDWIAARDSNERDERRRPLDEFRNQIALELGFIVKGRRRLPEGPRPDILKALVRQGRPLFELCWNVFPVHLSDRMQKEFDGQGVSGFEMALWTARLALPIFSRPEILALQAESEEAARWRRGMGSHPTARRFVIWVLAHRLALSATTLARTTLNTDDVPYFRNRTNPIDAYGPT